MSAVFHTRPSQATTAIKVIGTNVYIAYTDLTNRRIRFAKSIDNGANW